MEKNILEILTDNAINERLDIILLHNKEYRKAQKKIDRLTEELDRLELPKSNGLLLTGLSLLILRADAAMGESHTNRDLRTVLCY